MGEGWRYVIDYKTSRAAGLHIEDARVRIFHGDELVLAITPEGAWP